MSEALLPPFLNNTEPLEPEDMPLQLALLTMEVARLREQFTALSTALGQAATSTAPDLSDLSQMGFTNDDAAR